MDKITSLASFLSLFYVKNWCTVSVVLDASIHNLELWNQFKSMKNTETKTLKIVSTVVPEICKLSSRKVGASPLVCF